MAKKNKVLTLSAHKVMLHEYKNFLEEIKKRICSFQLKAAMRGITGSEELITLYWEIGRKIATWQKKNGWGAQVVEKLVKDLQSAFPGIEGFSRANIFRMKVFFKTYENSYKSFTRLAQHFEETPLFKIPWGHNIVLLQKLKKNEERFWYAQKSIEHGWSRNTLELWINAGLYSRESKAVANFHGTLPNA